MSLAETVIAVFLLLCACLVVVALFHSSLRYSARILVQSGAARVAEKHLAKVRSWARQATSDHQYNFDVPARWALYNGVPSPDTDEPEYQVAVKQALQTMFSPCSQLEDGFSASQQRKLTKSYRLVTVVVTWDPPLPANRLALTTLIGAPARPVPSGINARNAMLDATPRTLVDPLPWKGTITFDASVTDPYGYDLPDMFFAWHVIPGPGAGTVVSGNGIIDPNDSDTKRSGRSVAFLNNYPLYSNAWGQSVPGKVALGCVCRYRGLQCNFQTVSWTNE